MKKIILPALALSICLFSHEAWSSAAVQRQKQMKEAREQAVAAAYMQQYQQAQAQAVAQAQQQQMVAQAQQQIMAQAVQQQMAEQVQHQMVLKAQQEMIAQVQMQVAKAELEAVAHHVMEQVMAQKQIYAAAVRRKQVIDYTNAQQQAMVAAVAQQYQQAIAQEAIKQKIAFDAIQMAQVQQLAQAKAEAYAMQALETKQQANAAQAYQTYQAAQQMNDVKPFEPGNDQVADVVDISEVWKKLDEDSRSWALLIDNQAKVATVSEFADRFAKQGAKIKQPPIDYVQMIDDLAMQNPAVLTRPFKDILQLVAIMQYDFDSGVDKDTLARKMLGEQLYLTNKKRLGR
jgi:hypothetical protein